MPKMTRFFSISATLLLCLLGRANAFTTPGSAAALPRKQTQTYSSNLDGGGGESSPVDGIVDDLKMRSRILQESNSSGASFKQTIANVLAGEYNVEEVNSEIDELIASAPCGKNTKKTIDWKRVTQLIH